MLLHNSMHSCQAQTDSLPNVLGRKERLRNRRQLFRSNPTTGIPYQQADKLARMRFEVLRGWALSNGNNVSADGQFASSGHRIARIDCQFKEHLFHQTPVCQNSRRFRRIIRDSTSAASRRIPASSLLLLDLKLPVKSGLEILEWLRSKSALKDLKVIFRDSNRISTWHEKWEQLTAWSNHRLRRD